MVRSLLAGALALFVVAAPVAAQSPDPVRENYRAYAAALERNDLDAAETAARAALAASEQRDGEGGSTGVLALNLAHLLLERERAAEALAPARRAQAIAQSAGEASPIDRDVALLAVRRAELPDMTAETAPFFLVDLTNANEGGSRNESVYDAASDLGEWAIAEQEYETAIRAWQMAVDASPGDETEAVLARAAALRGVGAALLLRDIQRNRTVTVSNITRRGNFNDADASPIEPMIEAVRLTRPLTTARGSNNQFTNAQYQFALSLALLNAARSRLGAMNGWSTVGDITDWSQLSGVMLAPDGYTGGEICQMRVTAQPRLRYPREAQNRYGVGAVVMRIVFAPDGTVLTADPIATAGGEAFADAARRVRWISERSENAAPNCTVPAVWLRSITFTFDD